MTNRKETKRFSDSVSPGSTVTETHTLDADATVEEVVVRFYRGPELRLEVDPFTETVEDDDRRERQSLVDVFGRDVIVGDADHWSFDTDVPVERNDEIGVEVHNATGDLPDDQQFAYDYVVDITLDYEGGTSRFLPSFLSGVLS